MLGSIPRTRHDVQKARRVCCVAQGRLAVCSSHAAQAAGLLDVTPSFIFKRLGPHGIRLSLRPGV